MEIPSEGHLCTEMTSGATAGMRSGRTRGAGGEDLGVTTLLPPASLGVDRRLLSYVSSVTWTEKEVLDGEVREQDSQEQLV